MAGNLRFSDEYFDWSCVETEGSVGGILALSRLWLRITGEVVGGLFAFRAVSGCPDCLWEGLSTLLVPLSPRLLLLGAGLLTLRYLIGLGLYRWLPVFRSYVDEVHYPGFRARLGAGGLLLVLWIGLAGLLEELVFRGLFVPVYGIWLSALIFGGLHMVPVLKGERRQWPHVVVTTLSGLLYGWAFIATGSLWPGVMAHAGGNLQVSVKLWWEARRGLHPRPFIEGR